MNISTRHLKAFLTLAQEKNFTRAAALSHLSQPAFSMLIQGLEENVGVRLFDRGTRRVELSVEGRLFETSAERLLGEFDTAVGELKDLVALRKGRVTIAALPSLCAQRLPSVIADFRRLHPGIDVTLHDVTSDNCLDLLRRDRCDFALTAIVSATDLEIEPVLADNFFLACPAKHLLAKSRSRKLTVTDLLAWEFVQQDRYSSVRQQVEAVTYPHQLKTVMEVTNMATAAGLVEAGVGLAIIPGVARFNFERPGLVCVPLPRSLLARQISLVRQKKRQDSVAASAFVRLLKQHWKA
jgi:LysR family carnitine catabolism transcriptional activator